MGKDKDKKDKSKKKGKTKEEVTLQPASVKSGVAAPALVTYGDGAPLDKVTYLEAKLILKPDRFTSVQSFRDFGKLVKQAAKKVSVGFIAESQRGSPARDTRDRLRRHLRFPPLQQRVHPAAPHFLCRWFPCRRSRDRL